MENPTRTERTFGVTAELTPLQRRNLLSLRNSEVYPDLLDVMEMVCIETESDLINTPPEDEAAILAKHRMCRASWQVFTHLQTKIEDDISRYVSNTAAPNPPEPFVSDEEREVASIVNPLNYIPNGGRGNEENDNAKGLD